MNMKPRGPMMLFLACAVRRKASWWIAIAMALAGFVCFMWAFGTSWAVPLASFGAGMGFAIVCHGRLGLGSGSGRTQENGAIVETSAAPGRRTDADSLAGHGVWRDIDGNRDLLHLLHLLQERARIPRNDVPRIAAHRARVVSLTSVLASRQGKQPQSGSRGVLRLVDDGQQDE